MADVEATVAAMDLAEEHGVDLSQVSGTGEDGRITKPDVEAYIAESQDTTEGEPQQPQKRYIVKFNDQLGDRYSLVVHVSPERDKTLLRDDESSREVTDTELEQFNAQFPQYSFDVLVVEKEVQQ